MTKPSTHAMQAAREHYAEHPFVRHGLGGYSYDRAPNNKDIEELATRIDAAAEAIVRERLVELQEAAICAEYALTHPSSNQKFAADALRDALKGLEE